MTDPSLYRLSKAFPPIVKTLGATDTVLLPALGANSAYNYKIVSIQISNLSNAARTFTLYLRSQSVAPALANMVCQNLSIEANTLYQLPIGPWDIPTQWVISGLASVAGSVQIIMTGVYWEKF